MSQIDGLTRKWLLSVAFMAFVVGVVVIIIVNMTPWEHLIFPIAFDIAAPGKDRGSHHQYCRGCHLYDRGRDCQAQKRRDQALMPLLKKPFYPGHTKKRQSTDQLNLDFCKVSFRLLKRYTKKRLCAGQCHNFFNHKYNSGVSLMKRIFPYLHHTA